MNRLVVILVVVLSLALPGLAKAADPVAVDVLFMNHGPLRPTLDQLKDVFAKYGDKLSVRWHDFESQEGEKFMAKMGIASHVPLVIWINGKNSAEVDGVSCTFTGFPSGAGPGMFQGKWTVEQVGKVLAALTK